MRDLTGLKLQHPDPEITRKKELIESRQKGKRIYSFQKYFFCIIHKFEVVCNIM